MFYRLGRAMYRRRSIVLVIWVTVLLTSTPFALRVDSVLKGGGFSNGVSESERANNLLTADLAFNPSLSIIFSSSKLRATDAPFRRAMDAALAPAAVLPGVVRIDTQTRHTLHQLGQRFVSVDGHSALAILEYGAHVKNVDELVTRVRGAVRSASLQVIVAGDAAVASDLQTMSRHDLQKVEVYALPLAFVLIVLVFGTLAASGVPLALGLCSIVPTMALVFAIGSFAELSVFCLNVTTIIGLGVSIDYTLFIVSRYREERRRRSVEEAIAIALGTAGRAIMFSGVTVMIGLSGLFLYKAVALRSIGLGEVWSSSSPWWLRSPCCLPCSACWTPVWKRCPSCRGGGAVRAPSGSVWQSG